MSTYKSILGKQWAPRLQDTRCGAMLAESLMLPMVVAELLVGREVRDAKAATAYLKPSLKDALCDPFLLKDMDKAVEIIQAAMAHKKKIAIFGDYDVDGATSTALLHRYFALLGKDVTVYIPDRLEEGYGPNIPAFEKLAAQGHELIVTVDCGTTAFAPFEAAKELGLKTIVIDHHKAEAKHPPVDALVNPCRLDAPTPQLQNLAAVGLCFMTAVALNKTLRSSGFFEDRPEPDLRTLLDIVAVGTVADVVKLQGLNRAFVAQGLKVLGKRLNVGLRALSDVSNITQAPDAYHLGFILGPRINAGGRVGQADLGTRLLSTNDEDLAAQISAALNTYNKERQDIEAQVLEEAIAQVEDRGNQARSCIVVGGKSWHPGVIGIVASRLKEKYGRPSAVISFDETGMGKGSGRSVEGVDFGNLIHMAKNQGILAQGGGHAMAVGFALEQAKEEAFIDFLEQKMTPILNENQPISYYDLPLSVDGATLELAQHLEHLSPFGMGNPTPKFLFKGARLGFVEVVGKEHLKCRFEKADKGTVEGIIFRANNTPLGDFLLAARGKPVDFIGSLRQDTWMGRHKVKLFIEDVLV